MSENMLSLDVRGAMSAEGAQAYCSMQVGSRKEKAALYNATSNPAHKVGDYINRQLVVRDVYVESVEIEDEDTHEVIVAPRIVLIDMQGDSYQAVSKGVFNSLVRLVRTFGEPTWEDGLPLIVRQVSLGKNQMLTLAIDEEAL